MILLAIRSNKELLPSKLLKKQKEFIQILVLPHVWFNPLMWARQQFNPLVKAVCVYVPFVCDLYNNSILCIVCLPTNLYALCAVAERT